MWLPEMGSREGELMKVVKRYKLSVTRYVNAREVINNMINIII